MPPAEQVRTALEKVLASDAFARSERARELLRYIVEQDLEGNAERLKGFSIAIDVFGKNDSFDPATDTVVRVQAGRLRDLLSQYYNSEGKDDPLRIVVPRGSYVPGYEPGAGPSEATAPSDDEAAAPEPVLAPTPASAPAPVRSNWKRIAVAGAMLAAAVAVGLWLGAYPFRMAGVQQPAETASPLGAGEANAERTSSISGDKLPSVYLKVSEGIQNGDQFASALRRGLAAYDTIHFLAHASPVAEAGAPGPLDFVIFAGAVGGTGEVHIELQNARTRKVLLSRIVQIANLPQPAVDRIVADILTSVAPSSGTIYAYLGENGIHTPLTQCLMRNERFYFEQTAASHRAAYECFARLAEARVHSSLVLSELASLHMQAVVNGYAYPPDATPERALQLARMAVQLAPNSPRAHRSMGYVLSRSGTMQDGLFWTRKAHQLNPFDLGMAAAYGYALIRNGEYEEGTSILGRATKVTSAHPTWWDYGLFLGHFMLGDTQEAAQAASALGSSRQAHYLAARIVSAAERGRQVEAATLLAELQAQYPAFAQNPQAFFDEGDYSPDMTARLVAALRLAGLKKAG